MKKYLIILFCLLLASCGKAPSTTVPQQNQSFAPNIQHLEAQLKKSGIRGEKLQKYIEHQKQIAQKIQSFTWEKKQIIEIQQQVLPNIQKQDFVPTPCKNIHSTDLFLSCMIGKNQNLGQMIQYVPSKYQKTFKILYYSKKYTKQPADLFKKTSYPEIAIPAKEKALNNLKAWWLLKPTHCNKIPEPEVKTYCKKLF